MPVFNEAHVLPRTLDRLATVGLPVDWELIVVDDGSTDGSAAVAHRHSLTRAGLARIVEIPANRGKGAAVRAGFAAARGDIIGVQDADLEYDPVDIPALLTPLLDGRADAVFGTRNRGHNRPYSAWYKLGNHLLGLTAGLLFGRRVSDLYTGYKFMTRAAHSRLRLTANGFDIEAELAGQLFLLRARVIEVPISYVPRSRDEGKKIRPRDGLAGMARLLRVRLGSRP